MWHDLFSGSGLKLEEMESLDKYSYLYVINSVCLKQITNIKKSNFYYFLTFRNQN